MKILAISHSCVTDVNQQLYVSLNCLPDVNVEMIVPACWKSDYSGRLQTPGFLPGVTFPIYKLPIAVPGNISLHFYRHGLAQAIRRSKPDIVFVDEEPWSLSAAQAARICRRLRIPFVCYTKQNILKRYPLPFRLIEQRIYRSAAAIIALSEEVRDVLRAKGYDGPCPLLAHACDTALFQPRPSEEQRAALGLHGLVVGYLGRFVPEKGLDTLVQAVALLIKEYSQTDVTVLLMGAGPEEQNLRCLIAKQGLEDRFIFTGVVPHIQAGQYMNCMDIFALPSLTTNTWKEQFGRVIIEALACQVPVIGSDSGQIPFLIRDTGGGLIFEEGNSKDLAQQLLRIIKYPELRIQLGEKGFEAVRERYTYEAIAEQLYLILQEASVPSNAREVQ